jgi:hypothetical protein
MNTRPNNEQTTETADTQDAAPVASIKLDNVTGGWWGGYGPGPYGWGAPWGGPGPYGNPYAAARYAAAYDRAAQWYASNAPRYAPGPYSRWWY